MPIDNDESDTHTSLPGGRPANSGWKEVILTFVVRTP
jgi:hypothetical protein